MKKEENIELIREFLDLVDNKKLTLNSYHKPILVYEVSGDLVRYSIWESDLLKSFGLENVDGWDFSDSVFFCPDWVIERNSDEIDEY